MVIKAKLLFYSWEFYASAKGTFSLVTDIKNAYTILYLCASLPCSMVYMSLLVYDVTC